MLTLLLSALLGTVTGILTALIPGIHVNTLSLLIVGIAVEKNVGFLPASVFLICAAIAHLFIEFIPAIFLNAVDTSTVLVIQPSQRLVMKGRGYEAIQLVVFGGLGGFFGAVFLLPLFMIAIPPLYEGLRPYLGIFLLVAITLMIFFEKRRAAAATVLLLSGLFGLITLQNTTINTNYLLFPILTGLFGLSSLVMTISTNVSLPKQKSHATIRKKIVAKGSAIGLCGGILAGFLPGMGSSQSLAFAQSLLRLKGNKTFLVAQGAINVVDIVLSLMAILIIGNPRSGVAVSLQSLMPDLTYGTLIILLLFGAFAAMLGGWTTLLISRHLVNHLPKIPLKWLSFGVLAFLTGLIGFFAGWTGLIYAGVGTVIGLLPSYLNVKKSLLMGCLMIPTTLFFLGWLPTILDLFGL